MGKLFSGSKQPNASESGNRNMGLLTDAATPALGAIGDSTSMLKQLLGGDSSGFNSFKKGTGFDFMMDQGVDSITNNNAAKGLLRSGGTSKAIANYGQGLENQFLQQFMGGVQGMGQLGLGAGGLAASAGQYGKQNSSKGKAGIGDIGLKIGQAALMSDSRLKENIDKVGMDASTGLGIYEYNYKGSPTRYSGVMAEEVEQLVPEALGPEVNGYKSVNYNLLPVEFKRVGEDS
jgi:hypothetical protein